DTALDGAHRLAVGVPALEAGLDQRLPDLRELLEARAEQVDALPAGDLAVEIEPLGDLSEHDQLVGCDLAARDARYHRVGAAALDVGEKAVVGVLDGRVVEHVVVPRAGENRCDRRAADLAATAAPVARQQRIEALDAAELDDLEELAPGVGEVLAKV